MTGDFKLFARILSKNREVYVLKILTLAIAFASSILITLFTLNEFGFDKFHREPNHVFRVLEKNMDEHYNGNRLSVRIPDQVQKTLKSRPYSDSVQVSRVKILTGVSALSDSKTYSDQKIHAADAGINGVFSFEALAGNIQDFGRSRGTVAMLSSRAASKYFGDKQIIGQKLRLCTFRDTISVRVVAVFKDFPVNSHDDFDCFISYDVNAIRSLNFDSSQTGVYGRAVNDFGLRKHLTQFDNEYIFQSLPEIYFGPRVPGEEARHGDRYSVVILICIGSLILFLALSSFVNLTTITLPYRSKELAIRKLAGTGHASLMLGFLKESSMLVGTSLLVGLTLMVGFYGLIKTSLNLDLYQFISNPDSTPLLVIVFLFIILAVSPVFMTIRFVRAAPTRLLSTDTITFPRLKRIITVLQLGISIFLIISSIVVRRQINYSLVKEPGQNHDQVVYLDPPSGLTNDGIYALRSGWKKYNPNILDVMAVSQLPTRIVSKEIDSEFYLLQVDRGFREFFDLKILEGHWFGPNSGDSVFVVNNSGKIFAETNPSNMIGVAGDLGDRFNQPEKPLKIKLANDYNYNWLCVRVLEVDIRHTVRMLSEQFGRSGVHYLDTGFESWINYQNRLNNLSNILTMVSALLACIAIYGLSVSLVRYKLKEIAVHKLFGAYGVHIAYLLVRDFMRQLLISLIVFVPVAYILLSELLRTFVYRTAVAWMDPIYPIAYCVLVIVAICAIQAMSLNRSNFVSSLKG